MVNGHTPVKDGQGECLSVSGGCSLSLMEGLCKAYRRKERNGQLFPPIIPTEASSWYPSAFQNAQKSWNPRLLQISLKRWLKCRRTGLIKSTTIGVRACSLPSSRNSFGLLRKVLWPVIFVLSSSRILGSFSFCSCFSFVYNEGIEI